MKAFPFIEIEIEERQLNTYSNTRTIEGRRTHEGIAVLEAGLGYSEFELLDSSMPLAHTHCEMAHPEEVVVISGSIKISP